MPHPNNVPPMPGMPGVPDRDPAPGGIIPGEMPIPKPETPPTGPRKPYPVDDPVLPEGPGADPDYLPGAPTDPGIRL